SYACTTQAGLTRLGSNVMRTSRVVLRVRTRRATLASLLPWRGAVAGNHSLEWRPQKPITIPGSQLCSWNARRVLYQDVGNIVGSVISPMLANVFLHHVLDEWCVKDVHPRMQGRCFLSRFADDFIIGCECEADARRIMEVLPKRFTRFRLTIHPEKTA